MSGAELSIPFGLGLISSLHCSQMCGPLVLAYSLPLERAAKRAIWAHLSYNTGRLTTYCLLGAIAGAAGGGVAALGRLAGIEKTAAIIAGIAMLIAGGAMLGLTPRPGLIRIQSRIPALFSRTVGALLRSTQASSKLLLGLVLGLLPCGLVYAALIKAVDTGSALDGALSMLAFGAGTAGALLAIGVFSSVISARLGRYANTLAGVSVLLIGAFMLWRGVSMGSMLPGCHHAH